MTSESAILWVLSGAVLLSVGSSAWGLYKAISALVSSNRTLLAAALARDDDDAQEERRRLRAVSSALLNGSRPAESEDGDAVVEKPRDGISILHR